MNNSLTPEEQASSEFIHLMEKGWTHHPNERFILVSPQGEKYIFLSSAIKNQDEYDLIERTGVIYKILKNRFSFGWGIWFKTAKYKSYKLIKMCVNKESAQIVLESYTRSKMDKEYWDNWNLNNWTEDSEINIPKYVILHRKYNDSSYLITNYTELVNLCIHLVKNINYDPYYTKDDLKPVPFKLEDIPESLQYEAKRKLKNYENELRQIQSELQFSTIREKLIKLENKDMRAWHLDFINLVFDNPDHFDKLTLEEFDQVKKYI